MNAASRFSLETRGRCLVLWINYLAAVGVVPVALNPKGKEISRRRSVAKDASAKTRLTLRASSLLLEDRQPEPKALESKRSSLVPRPRKGASALCCSFVPLGRGSASSQVSA
jgi:hypothetical protein